MSPLAHKVYQVHMAETLPKDTQLSYHKFRADVHTVIRSTYAL